jgi:hypothetical protein
MALAADRPSTPGPAAGHSGPDGMADPDLGSALQIRPSVQPSSAGVSTGRLPAGRCAERPVPQQEIRGPLLRPGSAWRLLRLRS